MKRITLISKGYDGRVREFPVGINDRIEKSTKYVFWIVQGLHNTTKEIPIDAHCGDCSLFHPEADHNHNCMGLHNVKLDCLPFSISYNPSMNSKVCPGWKE